MAREPVDFQQIVGILGTAVFACIVRRPFAQMFGQKRVVENLPVRFV